MSGAGRPQGQQRRGQKGRDQARDRCDMREQDDTSARGSNAATARTIRWTIRRVTHYDRQGDLVKRGNDQKMF